MVVVQIWSHNLEKNYFQESKDQAIKLVKKIIKREESKYKHHTYQTHKRSAGAHDRKFSNDKRKWNKFRSCIYFIFTSQ